MPGQAAELVFDGATKVYGDGAPAVDQLSLTVAAGEICVLVGPSGGGKTTALKLVNRSNKVAAAGGAAFATIVNAVSAKLSVAAMRAMNKAVAIDKRSPAAVAGTFLKANGLK